MMSKKMKIVTAIVSVLLVIAVIAGITATALNKDTMGVSLLYSFMPKELEGEFEDDNGEMYKVTFYLRKNPDYDAKNDSDVLNAFDVYYYDADGNEVDLGSTGTYESQDQKINPIVLFLYKAMENFNVVKKNVKIGVAIFAVILIIALIVIWYIAFSKQEDERKAKLGSEKSHKHKNGKKQKKQ